MRRLVISLILSLPILINANSITDKLKHVSEQITHTKALLLKKQHAQQTLQQQLCETELNISHISNHLKRTHNRLKITQWDINALEKKKNQLNKDLALQLMVYTEQLQADYMITPQSRLKLLLNQQDPNQVDRYLHYANVLNQHHKKILTQLKGTKKSILDNQEKLNEKTSKLKEQQNILEEQQAQIKEQFRQRKIVLQQLSKQIVNKKQQLTKLTNNKQYLEKTLLKLQSNKISVQYFKNHRKHLPWPTKGSITTEFGSSIAQSQTHWNGVIISAKKNTPVHAIAPGKVVFSDWMAGYGLVLIIDHGNGYLTVYGRNSSLYKGIGDFVKRGTTIAQVGKSGGFKNPTLYFSIRHNTKALDPRACCIRHG